VTASIGSVPEPPARTGPDEVIDRARDGDADAFEALVAPYRGELQAHCYRILGSTHDADDAVQEALIGAWKGLAGFEARSSVRAWLSRIATHAAPRQARRRPTRTLSYDVVPPVTDPHRLGEPADPATWLEPHPGVGAAADPASTYTQHESIELAFVAALQHLPATQRAVLVLREVLGFPAAEVADLLDTTVPAVNSALQRARARLAKRVHGPTQQATLRELGDDRLRSLLAKLVAAWERADVDGLLGLLVEDARLCMPPLPAWFDGREAIRGFLVERMFATPWRVRAVTANAQPALVCHQYADGAWRLGSLTVLTLRGDRISELTAFLAPVVPEAFEISSTPPDESAPAGDS
jgi:RNA polymerase sigma-70 factor (TIGR02960 family)